MTRKQATALALKLHSGGKSNSEIAKELAHAGFAGRRGPLKPSGVNYLLKINGRGQKNKGTRRVSHVAAESAMSDAKRLKLVKAALTADFMSAEDRIEFALLAAFHTK